MNHLTPDELVDAVEETLTSSRRAHLDACSVCRQEAVQLAALLRDTRNLDVPEPSPLFWDRFSDRVRQAVATEPVATPRMSPWLRWPVLAPVAGLALLVLALVSAVTREPVGLRDHDLAMESTAPDVDPETAADAAWAVVLDLVGPLDFETAQQAGVATTLGSAERAALDLTDAEQLELVRLLRLEVSRSGG